MFAADSGLSLSSLFVNRGHAHEERCGSGFSLGLGHQNCCCQSLVLT